MRLVVITHGSFGNPSANWYPWLADELRARGYHVAVPRYPTPEGQTLSGWLRVFEDEKLALSPETILIGHSIGATFNLRLLECAKTPVCQSYFISGSITHLDGPEYRALMASFVEPAYDWGRIRANMGKAAVYHSIDDCIVPYRHGEELARNLQVQMRSFAFGGHFITESGFGRFAPLLEEILSDAAPEN